MGYGAAAWLHFLAALSALLLFPTISSSHPPSSLPPLLSYSNPTDGLDVAESSDATSIKTQMIGLLNAIQYLKGICVREGGGREGGRSGKANC